MTTPVVDSLTSVASCKSRFGPAGADMVTSPLCYSAIVVVWAPLDDDAVGWQQRFLSGMQTVEKDTKSREIRFSCFRITVQTDACSQSLLTVDPTTTIDSRTMTIDNSREEDDLPRMKM